MITTLTSFAFGYKDRGKKSIHSGLWSRCMGELWPRRLMYPWWGEGSIHWKDCREIIHIIPPSCRPPIAPVISKTAVMIMPLKSTFSLFTTTIFNRPVNLPALSPPPQPRNCLILLEALENVRRLPPAPSKLTSRAAFECPYSILLWCTWISDGCRVPKVCGNRYRCSRP